MDIDEDTALLVLDRSNWTVAGHDVTSAEGALIESATRDELDAAVRMRANSTENRVEARRVLDRLTALLRIEGDENSTTVEEAVAAALPEVAAEATALKARLDALSLLAGWDWHRHLEQCQEVWRSFGMSQPEVQRALGLDDDSEPMS